MKTRNPAIVVLIASRTTVSASSPGASRFESRIEVMLSTGASSRRKPMAGLSDRGKNPSSMQRCTRASRRPLRSTMNAKRSDSRPIRGT